jgi:hypothetical protein
MAHHLLEVKGVCKQSSTASSLHPLQCNNVNGTLAQLLAVEDIVATLDHGGGRDVDEEDGKLTAEELAKRELSSKGAADAPPATDVAGAAAKRGTGRALDGKDRGAGGGGGSGHG